MEEDPSMQRARVATLFANPHIIELVISFAPLVVRRVTMPRINRAWQAAAGRVKRRKQLGEQAQLLLPEFVEYQGVRFEAERCLL